MQAMQKHYQKQETEIHLASYKRKSHTGKKEEDLSAFETIEVIQYKLEGADRYCPDCGTKYKVVTKETVKRLKFIPASFDVVEETTYVYSCPKCGAINSTYNYDSLTVTVAFLTLVFVLWINELLEPEKTYCAKGDSNHFMFWIGKFSKTGVFGFYSINGIFTKYEI